MAQNLLTKIIIKQCELQESIMSLTELIILIADRNPNIRSLIMRELRSEGYKVRLAGTVSEIIYHITGLADHLILIILDPDLPDAGQAPLERVLNERMPPIPVIIHSLNTEFLHHNRFQNAKAIIEKDDRSIEAIKKVVDRIMILYSAFNASSMTDVPDVMHKGQSIAPDSFSGSRTR